MKKKVIPIFVALSLSLGIFVSPVLASKVDTTNSAATFELQEEDAIKDIKKSYKDSKVQKKLIEKVKKGEEFDSMNPQKHSLGVEKKLDDYTIQTTYPDGSQIVEGIDISEAIFYDEDGNEINNPYQPVISDSEDANEKTSNEDKKLDKFSLANIFNSFINLVEPPKAQAAVISGGTWSSGTGYSCVKGIKVFKQVISRYSAEFKADFCNHNGAYDKLSRIYSIDLTAGDSFNILSQGVFRSNETLTYSAYGGVKFSVKGSPESNMTTEYLYIRVGDDRYWYQSSF